MIASPPIIHPPLRSHWFVRRYWLEVFAGLMFFAGLRMSASAAPAFELGQVKAAFLFNFTKFVEWPADRFSTPEAPIVIGIVGAAGFAAELHETINDHRVNGHPVVVRVVRTPDEAAAVHLLYFADADDSAVDRTLAALSSAAVLTVGDSWRFSQAGGMISFMMERDKLRFDIDAVAAGHAGLKISAQLLKLARNVKRQL